MRVVTVLTMMAVTWVGFLVGTAKCHESTDTSATLSPAALEALVASVAFYPDATVEQILAASQYPDAIQQALQTRGQQPADANWPPSVVALLPQPEVLQQLHENAVTTARLALAAKTQLTEVWAAIDRVRASFKETVASGDADAIATESVSAAGVVYPSAAFVAGYWTAQVLNELQVWQQAYVANSAVVTTVHATGPAGTTVDGAAAVTRTTLGNTTHASAAAAGTITTPDGTTIAGQGTANGTMTQTGNGATYHTQAQGAVVSESGQFAAGSHSASGGYAVNSDGSVDFARNGHTSTNSSYGNSDISHSGSGTFTGQGTGSYTASTDIDSSHGDASITTTIGDGQAATTVTTADGTNTHSWGESNTDSALRERQRETAMQTERAMAGQVDSLQATSRISVPPTDTPFSFRRPSSGVGSLSSPRNGVTTSPPTVMNRTSSVLQPPTSSSGLAPTSSFRRPTATSAPAILSSPVPSPTLDRSRPTPSRSRRGRR